MPIYQISDPIAVELGIDNPSKLIEFAIQSASIREIGAMSVDSILSDGRQDLIRAISSRAQTRLDALGAGISLVSLEVVDLVPPYQVKSDFNAVQTADIEAETAIQQAREYRVAQIPLAESREQQGITGIQSLCQSPAL